MCYNILCNIWYKNKQANKKQKQTYNHFTNAKKQKQKTNKQTNKKKKKQPKNKEEEITSTKSASLTPLSFQTDGISKDEKTFEMS
jgi:hypothetical protein